MESLDRLVDQVEQEQDDILATLQLVRGHRELEDRLFEQLTDLLVESLFLDVRRQHLDGTLSRDAYTAELAALSVLCRDAGLLPFPSRRA